MPPKRKIEINGQVKSIRAWARFYGRRHGLIQWRLANGWDVLEALQTPPGASMVRRITAHGETRTIRSWAKRAGLGIDAIEARIERGWTPEEAVGPRVRKPPGITAWGKTQTYAQWAEETGIPYSTIFNRINRDGLPPEVALTLAIAKTGRKRKANP
jgi:hypothetical protein